MGSAACFLVAAAEPGLLAGATAAARDVAAAAEMLLLPDKKTDSLAPLVTAASEMAPLPEE